MVNTEIERKWLVDSPPGELDSFKCLAIEQAYLSSSPTVRVRKENDDYYLTYKSAGGSNTAISRTEYNLPLDRESYEHLKEKKDGILISKRRYLIPLEKDLTAELDIFDAPYEGLMVVEVEFDSEEQAYGFDPPSWFGRDVSEDPKYKNAVMAKGWTNEENSSVSGRRI